jgi:hypothetical protein
LVVLPAGSMASGVPSHQATLLELGPRSNATDAPYCMCRAGDTDKAAGAGGG